MCYNPLRVSTKLVLNRFSLFPSPRKSSRSFLPSPPPVVVVVVVPRPSSLHATCLFSFLSPPFAFGFLVLRRVVACCIWDGLHPYANWLYFAKALLLSSLTRCCTFLLLLVHRVWSMICFEMPSFSQSFADGIHFGWLRTHLPILLLLPSVLLVLGFDFHCFLSIRFVSC